MGDAAAAMTRLWRRRRPLRCPWHRHIAETDRRLTVLHTLRTHARSTS